MIAVTKSNPRPIPGALHPPPRGHIVRATYQSAVSTASGMNNVGTPARADRHPNPRTIAKQQPQGDLRANGSSEAVGAAPGCPATVWAGSPARSYRLLEAGWAGAGKATSGSQET